MFVSLVDPHISSPLVQIGFIIALLINSLLLIVEDKQNFKNVDHLSKRIMQWWLSNLQYINFFFFLLFIHIPIQWGHFQSFKMWLLKSNLLFSFYRWLRISGTFIQIWSQWPIRRKMHRNEDLKKRITVTTLFVRIAGKCEEKNCNLG